MKMNSVVHFQMPGDDKKRMSEFYNKAFGWESKQMGQEMGDYVVVQTTETDEKGMTKHPGAINGGFFTKGTDDASRHTNVVIAVEDIKAAMKRIEEAGGKINSQPDDIPGVGLFATFIDTEGNHVCILEPKGMGEKS